MRYPGEYERDVWNLGGEFGYDHPHREFVNSDIIKLIHKYINPKLEVDAALLRAFHAGFILGQEQYFNGREVNDNED